MALVNSSVGMAQRRPCGSVSCPGSSYGTCCGCQWWCSGTSSSLGPSIPCCSTLQKETPVRVTEKRLIKCKSDCMWRHCGFLEGRYWPHPKGLMHINTLLHWESDNLKWWHLRHLLPFLRPCDTIKDMEKTNSAQFGFFSHRDVITNWKIQPAW